MIFSERRLAAALGVFMLSVFLLCVLEYKFITETAIVLFLLTAGLFVLRFISKKSNKNRFKIFCGRALFAVFAAFAAVFFCILHYNISEKPALNYIEKYKDAPVRIKAEITDASSVSFMSRFNLKVYEINGEKVKKFNLSFTVFGITGSGGETGTVDASRDEIGSILETYVVFKPPEDDLTQGMIINYNKSNGYYIAADYYEPESGDGSEQIQPFIITPAKSRSLNYYLAAIRNYSENVFFKNIKANYHDGITQEAAAVYGIFAGNTDNINNSVISDFKKSGIYHALSVSGTQFSILCGIIFSILTLFKVNKKISCAVIILCGLVFMAFTGFSVTVIRSGIMMILFYAAFLIGRKNDSLTSLLIAGAFIILLNPHNILNISFQLSFFATLGIISFTGLNNKITLKLDSIKKFKPLLKLVKVTAASFIITIAATLFTLPFVSYNFEALSLISPVTNLLTEPLMTAVLFFSLCIMIFSFIPAILVVFAMPVYFITKVLIIAAHWLGSFKYSYISVESTAGFADGGNGFYIFSAILLVLIILCFIMPPMFLGSKLKFRKYIKPVLYSSTVLVFIIMIGALIYPRILFADSARFAYYSDGKNQNIILFQKDYDSADIIDITHGTQAHVKPTYKIIIENGALNINSITLSDYRKRHVQMIMKYLTYSDIKKVYVPEPLNEYDTEVLNSLYYLSVSAGFELIKYKNSLKLSDNTLITVNSFDYNKMKHMTIDIDYRTENAIKSLLYLGIGYKEGYEEYGDLNSKNYDIVFYGSHKHNLRDDNYTTDIYGLYAGVLSTYLNANKEKASQKLEPDAIKAYLSGSVLFLSDDYKSIIFEFRKDGEIKRYLK